jgi:hypothetical protein
MNIGLDIRLRIRPEDERRLLQLQEVFAEACNQVAPIAQQHRCWNRVALHHLTYRGLRERFPQLGSQMACNAVYAVSRACRIVYQGPNSPFNVRLATPGAHLPLIRFKPEAPVYFDRHTLNLKGEELSLFTLEGRLHCAIDATPQQRQHLSTGQVKEIALLRQHPHWVLDFRLQTEASTLVKARIPRATLTDLTGHVIVQPRPVEAPADRLSHDAAPPSS